MLSSFWETCFCMCIDDKCDFISDFSLSYFYDSPYLKSCRFNVLNTSRASPYRSDRTLTTAYMLTYRYTYVYCMSNKSSKVQVSTFGPLYYIIKTKCGDPLFLYPLALQGRLHEMLICCAAVLQLTSTVLRLCSLNSSKKSANYLQRSILFSQIIKIKH